MTPGGCLKLTHSFLLSIGKEALKKIVIEYEDLPFVLSLKHAQETLNRNLDDLEVLFNEATLKRCQKPHQNNSQGTL